MAQALVAMLSTKMSNLVFFLPHPSRMTLGKLFSLSLNGFLGFFFFTSYLLSFVVYCVVLEWFCSQLVLICDLRMMKEDPHGLNGSPSCRG